MHPDGGWDYSLLGSPELCKTENSSWAPASIHCSVSRREMQCGHLLHVPAALTSHHGGFYLKLWARINHFFLKLLLSGDFITKGGRAQSWWLSFQTTAKTVLYTTHLERYVILHHRVIDPQSHQKRMKKRGTNLSINHLCILFIINPSLFVPIDTLLPYHISFLKINNHK